MSFQLGIVDLANPVHRRILKVFFGWMLAVWVCCIWELADSVLSLHFPALSANRIYGTTQDMIGMASFGIGFLAISFWAIGYSLFKRQGRTLALVSLPSLFVLSLLIIFLAARLNGEYLRRTITQITDGFSLAIGRVAQYQRIHGFPPKSHDEAVRQELLAPPEHKLSVFRELQYIPPVNPQEAWELRTVCPAHITNCDLLVYRSDQECEYMIDDIEVFRINNWCYYNY